VDCPFTWLEPGRQWALSLADRVLPGRDVSADKPDHAPDRTTFGVSPAHRVIDKIGPLLALTPVRKRRINSAADSTLMPTRDHQLAALSKNYR
jgi:hypothetical protein